MAGLRRRTWCPASDNRPDEAARSELASWKDLCAALTASRPGNSLMDLEPCKRWGAIVARFSVTL
jgi:hypothetical protein